MIELRMDRQRKCGWRRPGGLYLTASGVARPCGKLPIPLDICPTCGGGIRPCRGWTWVNGTALVERIPCKFAMGCSTCPLGGPIGRVGLLWIGEQFYASPQAFLGEVATQGVSRRIAQLPKGFVAGKTWVLLAHRKAIANADGSHTAAIFQVFRPQAVEYVTRGDETKAYLAALTARGITPVKVERVGDTPLLEAIS